VKWHPLVLKFPELTGDRWDAFLDGIRATKGVRTTQVLYRVANGQKEGLAGRMRYKACKQLGLPCRMKRVRVPDAKVLEFVLIHDVNRRHLSPELERDIVAELRSQGMSARKIAKTMGTSKSAAGRAMQGVPTGTGRATGTDGKSYPATRPPVAQAARYDPRKLAAACDSLLAQIDACAACAGLDETDDEAGRLRGLAVSLRVQLQAWAESL
jgi:transposase-like protein